MKTYVHTRASLQKRRRNVATPPLVKSKRNRGANQENRTADFGGRRSRGRTRGA